MAQSILLQNDNPYLITEIKSDLEFVT